MLLDSTQLQNDGINIFLYFRLGFFIRKEHLVPTISTLLFHSAHFFSYFLLDLT